MVEKFKLNLIVAFIILLIVIWLIRARLVWDWVGQLLLLGVAALVVRTLLLREKKQAKLLEFFLKSLLVSCLATAVFWFVWTSLASPWHFTYLSLDYLMNELVLYTLPLALLPVAISVVIYGIFRTKLRAWEMFLSSWYVSVFIVFTVYQVWWSFYVRPHVPEFYYSSIAGAIALALGLVLLSFIIAGFLTIVYLVLRRQKTGESKIDLVKKMVRFRVKENESKKK